MSQCASSSVSSSDTPVAQPIKLVPKSVLNAHGCGGDCKDHDDSEARWPRAKVLELFNLPFNDLMWRAQQVHRQHWDANEVEHATLLSTSACWLRRRCHARPIVGSNRNLPGSRRS